MKTLVHGIPAMYALRRKRTGRLFRPIVYTMGQTSEAPDCPVDHCPHPTKESYHYLGPDESTYCQQFLKFSPEDLALRDFEQRIQTTLLDIL